jgi:hypothetical protein
VFVIAGSPDLASGRRSNLGVLIGFLKKFVNYGQRSLLPLWRDRDDGVFVILTFGENKSKIKVNY